MLGQVEHLPRPGVLPVDLVDHDDRLQADLERFLQDVLRLGHRPLDRVDQQQRAVGHVQDALDLAREVGVSRRVDDVDLDPAVYHGRVLRQDRDALLPLEVVRVEDQLADLLVGAEKPALLEHPVDQRRLAVVDVGDDRDVADVVTR